MSNAKRMKRNDKSVIIKVNKSDRKNKQGFVFDDAVLPNELINFSIIQANTA